MTAPSIILGSKAAPIQGVRITDTIISNKEENTYNKDDFVNINNIDNNKDIPLVIRGSFLTTTRGQKPKRVKGKES